MTPRYSPVALILVAILFACVAIWALYLSRPKPKSATLHQVNPALFAKSQFAYTFRRE